MIFSSLDFPLSTRNPSPSSPGRSLAITESLFCFEPLVESIALANSSKSATIDSPNSGGGDDFGKYTQLITISHPLKSPNFPWWPHELHLAGAPSSNSIELSSALCVPVSYNSTRIETTSSNGPSDPHSGQRFPARQLTLGSILDSSACITSIPPYPTPWRVQSLAYRHFKLALRKPSVMPPAPQNKSIVVSGGSSAISERDPLRSGNTSWSAVLNPLITCLDARISSAAFPQLAT